MIKLVKQNAVQKESQIWELGNNYQPTNVAIITICHALHKGTAIHPIPTFHVALQRVWDLDLRYNAECRAKQDEKKVTDRSHLYVQ